MALLGIEGFDNLGVIADMGDKPNWSRGASWATYSSLQTGRDGSGQALRSSYYLGDYSYNFSSTDVIFVGFALKIDKWPSTNQTIRFQTYVNNTTGQCIVEITDSGVFRIKRSSGGATVYTGTYTLPIGVWHYIEFEIKIHDTTGYVTIRVDGVAVESATGLDNQSDISSNMDRFSFGGDTAAAVNCDFDDFYILDDSGAAPYNTFLGDCRIETLSPNADGTTNNFTPSAGSNYQNVDETPGPDDDTSYNESSGVGNKDLYNMTALSELFDTVYAVMPEVYARKNDVGTRTINNVVRTGTTEDDGPARGLGESYAYHQGDILIQDPDTVTDWTAAGVNAAQCGLKIAS